VVLLRVYPYEPAAMVSDGGSGGRGGARAEATAWAQRQGEGVGILVLGDDAGKLWCGGKRCVVVQVVGRGRGGGVELLCLFGYDADALAALASVQQQPARRHGNSGGLRSKVAWP